jgi:hypothetical protein
MIQCLASLSKGYLKTRTVCSALWIKQLPSVSTVGCFLKHMFLFFFLPFFIILFCHWVVRRCSQVISCPSYYAITQEKKKGLVAKNLSNAS